ncbi:hypothetical protein EDB85DRAFT_1979187 [Lactarius pseudohatsudake]|nr:hypothetical protein EDB85DRAFT_1979187 [Lactarius pseudohatsudake]
MDAQIRVFIPWLSTLRLFPRDKISSVGDLLKAIWTEEVSPLSQGIRLSHCSLRTLSVSVPMEPQDTLQKRVAYYSARADGSADTGDTDGVPPDWSDPVNLRVYLYVKFNEEVQAAEQLYKTLWGKDLKVILEEISGDDGTTWKYVPETHIDSLVLLGYTEPSGLLVRPEFDIALRMLNEDHGTAKKRKCGGVVVTGQPGIGKTCFLYYALLRRLSEMKPVALERPGFFILFHDGGVYRYSLDADPEYLPAGTWALSDGNDEPYRPCSAFQTVSERRTAWLIQTTSQVEARWRRWRKYCDADMFVMNHISIEEMTVLSKVLSLDVNNIRHLYRKWGPSARTCLQLLLEGDDGPHECKVKKAADELVKNPNFDEFKVSHLLFSIRPENQNRVGRKIQIPEIATDHIKAIISYAAADADARDQFFHRMSTEPELRAPARKMFGGFVLCWLYAHPNVEPLRCFATDQVDLEIPACGQEQTTFFDSMNDLRTMNGDQPPFCLLPKRPDFPNADAVVITDEFVITIQVILSNWHEAKGRDFDEIKELIPPRLRRDKWRHVFITNSYNRASLPELPKNLVVYSGVFDIDRSGVTRKHMEALNEEKLVSGSWLHEISICWGITNDLCENSMEVDSV